MIINAQINDAPRLGPGDVEYWRHITDLCENLLHARDEIAELELYLPRQLNHDDTEYLHNLINSAYELVSIKLCGCGP